MKKIYAPWRSPYIAENSDPAKKEDGCIFCNTQKKDNVLYKGNHCFVILNKYPYSAGHLLIIPFDHQSDLNDISPEARAEMMELTNKSSKILSNALRANGINIGLNLGEAAGGGIPEHLHMHVLPRWNHDTNFMPLLADTKVISTDLDEIYDILKPRFSS